MKRPLKNLFYFALRLLPRRLRDEVVRQSIRLPYSLPAGLIFKIAETTEELEASFRLVYEVYLELGYCTENASKMRATVYHALPSTTTLIAVDQNQVVGTLTIVRDNRLGLPLDHVFDVKTLRKNSKRLAEITSLVIHKNYRREKGGQILFPLLRLMYEYSTSYFGVNHLLVTIHPKNVDFYKSLLLFKKVPKTAVKMYLGAPAVCLELDLNTALFDYQKTYSRRTPLTNLFNFFIERKIVNIQLPKRPFNKINDPLVHFTYFQDVFVKKLLVSSDRTERRRVESCLRQAKTQRMHPRIDVEAPAQFLNGQMTIKDVSRMGFRATFPQDFKIEESIELQIEIAPQLFSKITASVVWMTAEQTAGFEIIKHDENWKNFINFLYADQFGRTG